MLFYTRVQTCKIKFSFDRLRRLRDRAERGDDASDDDDDEDDDDLVVSSTIAFHPEYFEHLERFIVDPIFVSLVFSLRLPSF